MKLFVFEHCPFCVRAVMTANYKQLAVELAYLQNHDVDARIAKVGANMVPILQKPDGSYMAESLDIVRYLDAYDGKPQLAAAQKEAVIDNWKKQLRPYEGPLVHPRWMQIDLPEFQSQEAKTWYTKNKSTMIGMSFDQALKNSDEYISKVNALLNEIDWLILPSEKSQSLSYDDILTYPTLRNLTVIKGIQFPARVRQYLDEVTALTAIPLYDRVAV